MYTTAEVARLASLSPARIRRCVHAGLLRPRRGRRRRFEYGFDDLVLVRAIRALLEARIGPRRIAATLREVRRRLGHRADLEGLRLELDSGSVVVRERGKRWEPGSGQLRLPFERPRRARVRHIAGDDDEALRSFARALSLEDVAPREAARAYRDALSSDPEAVPALVNLGRLEHEAGRLAAAERYYLEALRRDPEERTAAFNLAVLAEDQGRLKTAVRRYQRLLLVAGDDAAAHHRLARLLARLGRHAEARLHMRHSRRLLRTRRRRSPTRPREGK